MKFEQTTIHQGGLFRCCVQSLIHQLETREVQPGFIVETSCGHSQVKLDDDYVWRATFEEAHENSTPT